MPKAELRVLLEKCPVIQVTADIKFTVKKTWSALKNIWKYSSWVNLEIIMNFPQTFHRHVSVNYNVGPSTYMYYEKCMSTYARQLNVVKFMSLSHELQDQSSMMFKNGLKCTIISMNCIWLEMYIISMNCVMLGL